MFVSQIAQVRNLRLLELSYRVACCFFVLGCIDGRFHRDWNCAEPQFD
jgi:hypothetical protein